MPEVESTKFDKSHPYHRKPETERRPFFSCWELQSYYGESYVVHPKNASNTLVIPLRPQKDIATDLEIHALVGARGNNEQFHVFKLPHKLPKFAMFAPSKGPVQRPSSSCVFTLQKQVRVTWEAECWKAECDLSRRT